MRLESNAPLCMLQWAWFSSGISIYNTTDGAIKFMNPKVI